MAGNRVSPAWLSPIPRFIPAGENDDEDDEDEDFDDEDEDFDQSCFEDSYYDSEGSDDRCPCHLHATYWPGRLNRERIRLREFVEKQLFSIFEVAPTVRLYNTLLA